MADPVGSTGDRRLILQALEEPSCLLELETVELDRTLRLLRRARLLGVVAGRVSPGSNLDDLFDRITTDQLISAQVIAGAQARVARWELDRLAWALDDLSADVPLVALKGCAYLLAGTPNVVGRPFADVDLMVPEPHLRLVEDKLRERGWQSKPLADYDDRYYREWAHELPPLTHAQRDVEVDLHHNILMRTARRKPDAALLFADARQVPDTRYHVLSPVDMVLHAIVHLFESGDMDDALRELVDISCLLRHFGEIEVGFWERFWPRACALDLARPAFYGLRYAHRWLAAPVPRSVLNESRAAAPPALVLAIMDKLVPLALFPDSLDRAAALNSSASTLLYLRSHWIRMPPAMLAKHLFRKFWYRHLRPAR